MAKERIRHGDRSFPRGLFALALLLLIPPAPAEAVKRRAFVTSVEGSGKISTWDGATGATPLDKADSICRARAAAAKPDPLPNANTYRAWLSTLATDAWCHVQGLSGKKANNCGVANPPGAGPWFLANGATNFSGTLDELVDEGEIYRPAFRDENFDLIPSAGSERVYWTGTDSSGVWTGQDCDGWDDETPGGSMGTTGDAHGTAGLWSQNDDFACAGSHRLLCFEPGVGEASTLRWSAAALVFLTSLEVQGDLSEPPEAEGEQGLAAGDRICQSLAEAAFLPSPGSFVAWLSSSAPIVDAADRIVSPGPFKRIDAFTVAGNFADLVDGTLDTSIHQFETGDYLTDDCSAFTQCRVWTGTDSAGAATASTCDQWSDLSGAFAGTNGRAAYSTLPNGWTTGVTTSCNAANHLYCISNRIVLFWDGFEITADTSRWSIVSP